MPIHIVIYVKKLSKIGELFQNIYHICKMEEIFKKLEDYSLYEISNLGRIKNIKTNKFIKQTIITKGYLGVYIYRDSWKKFVSIKVHRLIAETFIGKQENLVIDHIDNNKQNNNLNNLQYVTNRYNIVKQKLFSKKGFIRKNKNVKIQTYTIEYRKPSEKRKSFTSNNINNCINHYCLEMDKIDKSVSKLVRDFYNIENTELISTIAKGVETV